VWPLQIQNASSPPNLSILIIDHTINHLIDRIGNRIINQITKPIIKYIIEYIITRVIIEYIITRVIIEYIITRVIDYTIPPTSNPTSNPTTNPDISPAINPTSTLISTPTLIIRKYVNILRTGAWLGHHIDHCVAPFLIVRCFFMPGRIIRRTINLYQGKSSGVILLLDNVKAGNPCLLQAAASIFHRGSLEGFNPVRFDMRKNMDYEHGILPGFEEKHLSQIHHPFS
jgi:hypothetical protein